ncbi:MAG: hypothetical protein A2219_05985 [Elusimicrobia bacterium RIFOXYA2_FULL_50_26]|nr:MAG: hypothetical protein A2219_05985 [Elusimicrobia bacterium RIFOXYA2_FULL_50_26]OGS24847.1 MAG: hypothetical protein A2314_02205 [Elusimicrobia bacterium RIFOXYB2_FULL_50_12]
MNSFATAREPFRFYTRMQLAELTGLKASNLEELLYYIKQVPTSSIYQHTHRYLQQHQYVSPEPPNDFAYWVSETLKESELAEELASIDTIQYPTLRSLREKIILTIENHLSLHPKLRQKNAPDGHDFYFVKSVNFILPTNYVATNLHEFTELLKKITLDSIYFHIFEARLRLEKGTNDFSRWIETSVGDKELADRIAQLDPYTHTLEHLRGTIIKRITYSTVKV